MREKSLFKKGFKYGLGSFCGLFFGFCSLKLAEKYIDKSQKRKAENVDEIAKEFCEKYNIKYDKPESQEKTEK